MRTQASLVVRLIENIDSPGEMTTNAILDLCIKNEGYEDPTLNDKLYLHYAGFNSIPFGVLDYYFNVRALFLQANGLKKIENLEALT